MDYILSILVLCPLGSEEKVVDSCPRKHCAVEEREIGSKMMRGTIHSFHCLFRESQTFLQIYKKTVMTKLQREGGL